MKVPFNAATTGMLVCLTAAACTVHQTKEPPLSGPSVLALDVRMEAIPDAIAFDGGSQSSVRVSANGPDGKSLAGVSFRVETAVESPQGLVVQDFGGLSARTIVTGSNGQATVIFTAPAPPPGNVSVTCSNGLPGSCVTILATPTGTNFGVAPTRQVNIRLVPLGVILPPAGTPRPSFTFTPTTAIANSPVVFDASASCGSTDSSGACNTFAAIKSYNWTFGDGETASGRVVSHSFKVAQTYSVTLTVTNDRDLAASVTQTVTVGAGAGPVSAQFRFSPTTPLPNQVVFFDATEARAGTGHVLTKFSWQFGDGGSASGVTVSHSYTSVGIFNVTLTVADEAGQTLSSFQQLTVGTGVGLPTANFTFSPPSPITSGTTVTFDATSSTAATGARVVAYDWDFGDGSRTVNTSMAVLAHAYAGRPGFYTISLRVTDDVGRVSPAATRIIEVR